MRMKKVRRRSEMILIPPSYQTLRMVTANQSCIIPTWEITMPVLWYTGYHRLYRQNKNIKPTDSYWFFWAGPFLLFAHTLGKLFSWVLIPTWGGTTWGAHMQERGLEKVTMSWKCEPLQHCHSALFLWNEHLVTMLLKLCSKIFLPVGGAHIFMTLLLFPIPSLAYMHLKSHPSKLGLTPKKKDYPMCAQMTETDLFKNINADLLV